jgi:DNA-binding response OmpR family regulator
MRRILVIDASAAMRALYRETLAQVRSASVRYASNGAEAMAEIRTYEPALAFLDIDKPNSSGLEVLSELRRAGRLERMHVVLVATEGTHEDVEQGMLAGAIDYLRKPFTAEELIARVDWLAPATNRITIRPGSIHARPRRG